MIAVKDGNLYVLNSDYDLEDDGNSKSKFPEFNIEVDMENPQVRVRMLFASREQLKEAVKQYSRKNKLAIKFKRNDKDVGIDANDCIYLIAVAVVELENRESWEWFLELLKVDLEIVNSQGYTFMFDKQKATYEKIYSYLISPIRGALEWEESNKPPILPLMLRRPLGRPKKTRRKVVDDEKPNGGGKMCKVGI
ncbi:hypothetical protein SLEP1_g706 [Rubroshorea leprosula]|uniref:Uncharacterized protein n=1 Tax=Rubroshorea leprosula TaxID=152421 RepID=A0AAV5HI55_9ROSI|nr:hypothetical protein SLEP1_g706 [Rubroshorea leprosula]